MIALVLLAAGFTYPDIGATALGRGATGAAQGTGDLASVLYNPAGLVEVRGLRLQADVSSAFQSLDFTRACATCGTVSNSGGAFLNTVTGVSWEARRGLVFAASVYGPPSIGRETFPDPRVVRPSKAPQRYSLISSDDVIIYPGVAAAWRALPWLDVGAVVQVRYFRAHHVQSIFSVGGVGGDIPDLDAVVDADATDRARLTGGLGVTVRPLAGLSLGLSARPSEPVHATGTLAVTLPSFAAAAGASVEGNAARIDLRLPAQARLGVRYERGAASGEVDATWENWGSLDAFTVTPVGVLLHQGGTTQPVGPIAIPRRWHAAFSVRAGGEYTLGPATLRAGALVEQSAIPDETLQIDFVNVQRAAATLGATLRHRGLAVTAGWAHFFPVQRTVTTSTVTRTDPYDAPAFVIGNGTYSTSLDVVALQLAASL